MLVLSRRKGEQIFIGDNVTLTVVKVDRGKVVLGFQAPPEVRIERDDMRKAEAKERT